MARVSTSLFLTLLLVLLLPSPSHPLDDGLDKVRFSSGLETLFSMTSNFINTVQSYTIGELFEEYNIETFDDLASKAFLDQKLEWSKNLYGFAACLVVGILFIVFMPIIGCCFGCCRCKY